MNNKREKQRNFLSPGKLPSINMKEEIDSVLPSIFVHSTATDVRTMENEREAFQHMIQSRNSLNRKSNQSQASYLKEWTKKLPGTFLVLQYYSACGRIYRRCKLQPAFQTWTTQTQRISSRMREIASHSNEIIIIQRSLRLMVAVYHARQYRQYVIRRRHDASLKLSKALTIYAFKLLLKRRNQERKFKFRSKMASVIQKYWRRYVGQCKMISLRCQSIKECIQKLGDGRVSVGISRLELQFNEIEDNVLCLNPQNVQEIVAVAMQPSNCQLKSLPAAAFLRRWRKKLLKLLAVREINNSKHKEDWNSEKSNILLMKKEDKLSMLINGRDRLVCREERQAIQQVYDVVTRAKEEVDRRLLLKVKKEQDSNRVNSMILMEGELQHMRREETLQREVEYQLNKQKEANEFLLGEMKRRENFKLRKPIEEAERKSEARRRFLEEEKLRKKGYPKRKKRTTMEVEDWWEVPKNNRGRG